MDALPGAELVEEGIRDLARGAETQAACLVSIGAPRLRTLGWAVPEPAIPFPEHRLYALLAVEDQDSAHAHYNALVRRPGQLRARGRAHEKFIRAERAIIRASKP